MTQTYLNGKLTVTSLAAPTVEDMQKIKALSSEDRKALIDEALAIGEHSPFSEKSIDDIWDDALQAYQELSDIPDYAQ